MLSGADILRTIKLWVMPIRKDWNALGPKLPHWFVRRLEMIDPQLRMQFIPVQSSRNPDGLNPLVCPSGAWIVCRRLRRTRWLFKRWVYSMCDSAGKPVPPSMDMLRLIRLAHRMWRRGQGQAIEDVFDKTLCDFQKERASESRKQLAQRIQDTMRRCGMTSCQPRVFIRKGIPGVA